MRFLTDAEEGEEAVKYIQGIRLGNKCICEKKNNDSGVRRTTRPSPSRPRVSLLKMGCLNSSDVNWKCGLEEYNEVRVMGDLQSPTQNVDTL